MVSDITHFGLIFFSGDPVGEHPDPELHGQSPGATLIAAGPEDHCWAALDGWTRKRPLRMWETAEVVERHPSTYQNEPDYDVPFEDEESED